MAHTVKGRRVELGKDCEQTKFACGEQDWISYVKFTAICKKWGTTIILVSHFKKLLVTRAVLTSKNLRTLETYFDISI